MWPFKFKLKLNKLKLKFIFRVALATSQLLSSHMWRVAAEMGVGLAEVEDDAKELSVTKHPNSKDFKNKPKRDSRAQPGRVEWCGHILWLLAPPLSHLWDRLHSTLQTFRGVSHCI